MNPTTTKPENHGKPWTPEQDTELFNLTTSFMKKCKQFDEFKDQLVQVFKRTENSIKQRVMRLGAAMYPNLTSEDIAKKIGVDCEAFEYFLEMEAFREKQKKDKPSKNMIIQQLREELDAAKKKIKELEKSAKKKS